MADDCLFCKIVNGKIPSTLVYEDETAIAFRDINPQAPEHALVIPRKHIETLAEMTEDDLPLMGHLYKVVQEVAKTLDIFDSGWRSVINCRNNGGQTVYHLHIHVLGGRFMRWPPG